MKSSRITRRGKRTVVLLLTLLLLLVVLGGFLLTSWKNKNDANNLQLHLKDFTDQSRLQTAPSGTPLYLRGKVLALDITRRPLVIDDSIYQALSPQQRANTPREVETVLWISCQVQRDNNTYNGFYITCVITVVDWVKALIVGSSEPFVGATGCAGCLYQRIDPPTAKMIEFVKSLSTTPSLITSRCPYTKPQVYIRDESHLTAYHLKIFLPQECYIILSLQNGSYSLPEVVDIPNNGSLLAYQGSVTISAYLVDSAGGIYGFSNKVDAKAFYCKTLHSGRVYSLKKMPSSLDWASTC